MGILQCPAQLRLPNEAVKHIIARKKESAYNMGYMYMYIHDKIHKVTYTVTVT